MVASPFDRWVFSTFTMRWWRIKDFGLIFCAVYARFSPSWLPFHGLCDRKVTAYQDRLQFNRSMAEYRKDHPLPPRRDENGQYSESVAFDNEFDPRYDKKN